MPTTPTDKPPILEVLRHYFSDWETPRRDSGSWQPCKCPAHPDRTASASINIDENRIHCHACDFSHDSWSIIMEEERCEFLAAVETAHRLFDTGGHELSQPAHTRLARREVFGESRPHPGQRSILSARIRRRPSIGT
ncbi:CHC2 zinc finger domain-containing protein [Streptomyces sp. NPDC045456]|uniref:CHC2 zinc finger domain-containing protein n=1 Tax=unclassified Streptomyces TaxID=2593676 RepID=UPI0033C821E9